jgi:transposase
MAYQKHPIGTLIAAGQFDRRKLREACALIVAAFEATSTQKQAAARLACNETTLIRWVNRLDLGGKIAQIRKKKARTLSNDDRSTIRRELKKGTPQSVLAERFGRTQARISQIGRQ